MIVTIAGTLLVGIGGYAGHGYAAATAASIFGNLATDWLKSICRFGDAAYLRHYNRIDRNHVVVRTIRDAHLAALADVLHRFDSDRRGHRDTAQDNFSGFLRDFLARERPLARKLRFEGAAEAGEDEKKLRRDLLKVLPDAAAAGLAAQRAPTAAEDRDRFRRACELAALAELRALVFEDIPPLFLSAFAGNRNHADGWFDLFFRRISAEIGKGGEFAQRWQAEQVAAIQHVVGATAAQTTAIAEIVGQIRAALIAQETAISALAGDVGAIRAHVAAIHARTFDDRGMPLDFPTIVDTGGHLRFAPRNPLVPFFGRAEEMDALQDFLATDPDFAWWLLCGAGGAGKTRLALRLAMWAHAEGWRAGFLPKYYKAEPAAIDTWQPQRPTLIIADYTLKRRDAVRILAERLALRAGQLPQPVRLLMIEREGGNSFDAQLLGDDSQGVIRPHRHADPVHGGELALPALTEDDLWALAEGGHWNAAPRPLSLPRAAFFARLDQLDADRRPLVAMILADAMSADAERPALDSLQAELRALLERDRRDLWPAELGCAKQDIGAPDADAAIAFATMLDGMDEPGFEALEAACGRGLNFDEAACAHALGSSFDPHRPSLPPLEPDLIGEFFALEVLDSRQGFRGLRYPRLGEAAWRHHPDRMADFVRRAGQNFPGHAAVAPLQVPIPGLAESWRLRGYTLLTSCETLDAGLVAAADALRAPAMRDAAAAATLAEIAVGVTALPDEATSPGLRRSLLDDVAEVAEQHQTEPALREQWAKAANNYIARRAAEEPAACGALLAAMRDLADQHPAEPALREQWAKAAFNYITHRAAEEPAACGALLAAMRDLADQHPAEPALREQWANAATNYIAGRAAEEPAACGALLAAMRDLADQHTAEPALRELWVRGCGAYVFARRAIAPDETLALVDSTAALAAEHPGEDGLFEWHAMAAVPWLQANVASHQDAGERVWQRLLRLAETREALLQQVLARFGIRLEDQ